MINPFYVYSISNIFIILAFSLGWSSYYQTLSFSLYLFLVTNTIISLVLGISLKKKLKFKAQRKRPAHPKRTIVLIFFLFCLDFIYSQQLPLVNIFTGHGQYYKEIDHIPVLYPILMGFTVFYVIFFFISFLSFGDKVYFYISLLLLLPFILEMARGVLIMAILTILLIYYSKKEIKLSLKMIFKGIIVIFTVVTLFGYLGDIRSASYVESKTGDIDSHDIILSIGDATEKYRDLSIPNGFFWVYLYAASPIANFDNIINKANVSEAQYIDFFIYNFTPQSFQKKSLGKFTKDKSNLVVDFFNVSTMYSLPFLQKGWFGVILFQMSLYLYLFIFIYFLRKSEYLTIFLSVFTTSMLLSGFSNMLVLDVIFIPLMLSVIYSLFKRLRSGLH